ncbi:YybH family protein [Leptospira sp. GIMC2001]|uniref:YybH family protein n=1 Tax=Leptospira sp. GIMC2001 TaxID=1513297 RepID=UPI002349A19D|nr:nuclear transport factor 2 family protein [Leptospira sp. GIMC2001]WCL49175.1 nuclear transport factor 2 family protein [Leptospira sp. GIMC2001]
MGKFNFKCLVIFIFFSSLLPSTLFSEDSVHNELRKFKVEFEEAVETRDIAKMLEFVHPNVVITFVDAQALRGHTELSDYLNRLLKGPSRLIKNFNTKIDVDELTIMYGNNNVGISFGSSDDYFNLTEGLEFHSKSRWTATLVKENNKWLIASAHVSVDMFKNPLLTAAKNSIYIWALISFILGTGLGYGIFRFIQSRK